MSPILLIALGAELALWRTGETWPIDRAISAQAATRPRLFMRGILDQGFYRYKFLQIQQRKPRILVLGSSRVMEFRAEMFPEHSNDFFNAGGMIQDLSDLKAFAQRLTPENSPHVAIIGLDLWWFNENKPLLNGLPSGLRREAACDWQEHVRAFRRLKSAKGRQPLLAAWRAPNLHIGIEARAAEAGFRRDGSMEYNFPPPLASDWGFVDRENPPIPDRIRNRSAQFTLASGASSDRLRLLAECLEEFQRHHVLVLGFLPPFSSEAASLLEQSSAHSNLWHAVRREVPRIFREQSFPFVDATRLADLGLDDRYLIDGIHAAETFHLYLLKRFLAIAPVQKSFPNLEPFLDAVIRSPATDPWRCDYRTIGRTSSP